MITIEALGQALYETEREDALGRKGRGLSWSRQSALVRSHYIKRAEALLFRTDGIVRREQARRRG